MARLPEGHGVAALQQAVPAIPLHGRGGGHAHHSATRHLARSACPDMFACMSSSDGCGVGVVCLGEQYEAWKKLSSLLVEQLKAALKSGEC